ncbi:MAG: hypothetical protein NTV01_12770 [Bacteroidia bacterium]|nr:hypothetical protein [Bacteroidia bacterium]
MKKLLLCLVLVGLMMTGCRQGDQQAYEFQIPGIAVNVNGSGEVSRIEFTNKNLVREVKILSRLADCDPVGRIKATRKQAQISFRRKWISKSTGNSCILTDRFSPGNGSIRWEIEITGLKGPWTTPIETRLIYPDAANAKFWTAWGDPRLGEIRNQSPEQQASLGILPSDITGNWSDPLIPIPFVNDTIWYGAPPYGYDNPRLGFCPFQGNLLGIPMVSISEDQYDTGLSVILSPEDTLLDLNLRTSASGELVFSRYYHRISSANTIRFHLDIVAHESGWRGGLRWMAANYPAYFNPNIPLADEIAGTGAYSSLETAFDLDKMNKMAFGVNWKASFDFPYMGMFIPPVETDTAHWNRYGGNTTSIRDMREYATRMKNQGFHVLSYFNVTEFGANITDPKPPRKEAADQDLWKSADDFLYYTLADAILHVPGAVTQDKLAFYPRSRPKGPYYTWGNGIIMDPGEPDYQAFLLDQAKKHIEMIPDAEGICIDRMDWLRMYNEERDDNVSWFGNQPTRSLLMSWNNLLDQLGPLMHKSGKVIFINNHDKRIDLLRQTDGYFDEFTYGGSPLNLTSLMGVRRPVLGWTSEEKNLRPDPDAFFQRYLHLGVYPMAPFPGNDHSLLPGEWVDKQYLDYGPMMQLMKGKKWVLEPHCIEVVDLAAKANLFEVPGGWVVPVTFGPQEGAVTVMIRNVSGMKGNLTAEALYPGIEKPVSLPLSRVDDQIRITVATHRGCAMVRIVKRDE